MGKTRKNIHSMTVPSQYYYPTMLVPYIPPKRTKKRHIKDFRYTYGHSFRPEEFLKPPKTRIVFNKNDDIYQFTKNTLSLYNIDYNPSFVEFSLNNFKSKIKEYLSHYRNKNLYIDSVNSIRKSSELLELEKVLNEHELHLILEGIDTMFEYANFKNFKIKQDSSKFMDMHNFIMKDENFNKLQKTLVGGGNIKKFDIINYVNGNKRKEIKERITNLVYVDFENTDLMGYIYDQGWPNDFERNLNDKKRTIINDEILDTCFDAFIQQKVYTHLGFTDKDTNPYYRGEFQKNLKGCKDKKYYDPDFFEDELPMWAYMVPGSEKPKAFEKKSEDGKFKGLDDKFEFTEGRSMINIDYLNFIKNNTKHREKFDELKELIDVYHKLQIPDTRFARNKEKMLKEYLSSISMAIIMLGMLPPSFFGEDYDFNPFDVLSTVMCIFEGSTVCAVMSALPLFSPFLDMLSTFSIVRKILNKFGVTGAVGKRSQAAIKKAQQRKIAKQNAFMEKGVKLKADLSTMARNIDNAKGLQKQQLKKQFDKLKKANENYAKQSKKMAEKGVVDSMKRAKAQSKGAEKLVKQLNSGAKKVESLTPAEKAKLQRYTELLNMQKSSPNLKLPRGVGVKDVDGKLKNLNGVLKGSTDGRKILKNGKKAADESISFLNAAQKELSAVQGIKTPEAAVTQFGKYEIEMAKINDNRQMLASGVNSQGVKLSQKKLDDLGAQVKKSFDDLSPKHLVESRNYSDKQLKYLQTGKSPPVDKMARYEQSFKPSSESSINQIKKQQQTMKTRHQERLARKKLRAKSKISGKDARSVSQDIKNFKRKTSDLAREIKFTQNMIARNPSDATILNKQLTKQKAQLDKTMKEGLEEIGKKTEGFDPSTKKIIDDATDAIVAKRLKQSGFDKGAFLKPDGNFLKVSPTIDKKARFTGTLISSPADKAKVRRALRGKQLKASEESIKKAKEAKKNIESVKKKKKKEFGKILGKDYKVLDEVLDETAKNALKNGDFTPAIKALDKTNVSPDKITRIKALQAEMKAAEAQSKYAAAVARKNFDKVITGQTKKRFYDFRTWGKEGRTKKLNNFKKAQIDAKTGEQIDLMKGIDDVVTPGLTRVKNKDVKYFKAQAEVAEQEAILAARRAEEVSFHQKILKEKQDEFANLRKKMSASNNEFNKLVRQKSNSINPKEVDTVKEQLRQAEETLRRRKEVFNKDSAMRLTRRSGTLQPSRGDVLFKGKSKLNTDAGGLGITEAERKVELLKKELQQKQALLKKGEAQGLSYNIAGKTPAEKFTTFRKNSKVSEAILDNVRGAKQAADDAVTNAQEGLKQIKADLAKSRTTDLVNAEISKKKALSTIEESETFFRTKHPDEYQAYLDAQKNYKGGLDASGEGREVLAKKLSDAKKKLRESVKGTDGENMLKESIKAKKELEKAETTIKGIKRADKAVRGGKETFVDLSRGDPNVLKQLYKAEIDVREAMAVQDKAKKKLDAAEPYFKEKIKVQKQIAQAEKNLDLVIAKGKATDSSRKLEKAKIQNLRNKQVLKKTVDREKALTKELKKLEGKTGAESAQKKQELIDEIFTNKTQQKNLEKSITDYELTYDVTSKRTKKLKQTLKEKKKLLKEKERPSIVYKVRNDIERKAMVANLKSNIARIESRMVPSPKTSRKVRRTARKKVKTLQKQINMDGLGLSPEKIKEFGNIEKEIGAARLKVQMADKGAKNIYRTGPDRLRSYKKGRLRRGMEKEQIELQKRFDAIGEKHNKAQAELKNYNRQLEDLQNELEISKRTSFTNNIPQAEKQLREEALQTSISVLEKKKNLAQARIAQRQQEFLEAAQGSFTRRPLKKFKRTEKGLREAKKTAKKDLAQMFTDKGIQSKKTFEKGLEKLDKSIKKQKEITEELGKLRKASDTPANKSRIELLESNLALELAKTNQNFKRIKTASKKRFGETFLFESLEKKIKKATQLEFDKVADMSADLAKLEKRTENIIKNNGFDSPAAREAMEQYTTQFQALEKQKKVVKDVKMAQFHKKAVKKAKNRLKKSEQVLEKEVKGALKEGEEILKKGGEKLEKSVTEALKKEIKNRKDFNSSLDFYDYLSAGMRVHMKAAPVRTGAAASMAAVFAGSIGALSGPLIAKTAAVAATASTASGVGAAATLGVFAATSLILAKQTKVKNARAAVQRLLKNNDFLKESAKDLINLPGFNKAKYSRFVNKVEDVNSNLKFVEGQTTSLVKVADKLPQNTAKNVLGNKTFQEIAKARGKAPPPPINISKGEDLSRLGQASVPGARAGQVVPGRVGSEAAEQTAAAERAGREAAERAGRDAVERAGREAAEKAAESRLAKQTADAAAKEVAEQTAAAERAGREAAKQTAAAKKAQAEIEALEAQIAKAKAGRATTKTATQSAAAGKIEELKTSFGDTYKRMMGNDAQQREQIVEWGKQYIKDGKQVDLSYTTDLQKRKEQIEHITKIVADPTSYTINPVFLKKTKRGATQTISNKAGEILKKSATPNPPPDGLTLGADSAKLQLKRINELEKGTKSTKVVDAADAGAIAKLEKEVVTATAEQARLADAADAAAEQARLAREAAERAGREAAEQTAAAERAGREAAEQTAAAERAGREAAEAAEAATQRAAAEAAKQRAAVEAAKQRAAVEAAEASQRAAAEAAKKAAADAAEKSSEAAKQAAKAAEAGKSALRNARILESGSDLDRTKLFFKNKMAIESGKGASKSLKKINARIKSTERNIRLVGDGKEAAALNERLLRLKGDKELLEYNIKKGKIAEMTQAEKTMGSAIEAVESKLEILKLQEAVKPVVPPIERLQQFLDNLADAYLVKYNVEEEYKHIQDVEFDKRCADANNKLLDEIWSKNGQDALLKFGTILGGSVGDMGGVFTALQAFQKQSKFLKSFDLTEEEKEKKIQELRFSKHKRGVSDREKERRINYGTEIAEESFLRKKGKTKNKLTEDEGFELENAKLNARIKSDELSYEELNDVMDTHTEDFLNNEGTRENKISEIDELMQEDLGKRRYQLRNTESDRAQKEMIKELSDKRRTKSMVERKRLKEFENEQDSLEDGNEMKVLQPGESKTSTPRMRIEGATVTQSENTSAGRFISTGNRTNTRNINSMNNNKLGGGKKKVPELTLRNEVVNDSQLRKALDKFTEEYKGYMMEFNIPLQELMKKRSDYKIKQKLSLKENFLKLYRDTKSEVLSEVEDIKKLEFTTFEQQNNYYTKQKKQLFKAISGTGGNAFMILNVQLGTFNKGNKLINEIEKLEVKMNKMIEDKEISDFIRKFNEILEKIGKKEVEIKKIKKDIQEFKAKDADLDKLLKELSVLDDERKNYNADTNKKKTYIKMSSKLRVLAKELSESKEFINLYEKFKKDKMSFDVFRNNKKGQFDSLKKMLIDEIKYIKNEYDISKFFSLGISEIKKLTLVEVLQSIYLDIFKVKKSFEIINEFYEEENPKVNKEIKSGERQINFYYRTREKILIQKDKELFEKRYDNRRNNLKLLKELQVNLVKDHVDNLNIIDKCNDLLYYCDFNINNIKNMNIIQETKTKILTDKYGLIDINELHEKQLDRGINLTYKELSEILDDILSYRKIINSSRVKLKKSITNKHIKKGKITKVFLEEKKKGNTEKKKDIHERLKTVDKRLMDYEAINIDYMNFEKPIDLLIFYKILDAEINIDGKMEYTFNKLGCEMRDIKVDLILEDKLNSINTFINTHEIV